jgi:CubicO group peptidase (beta-lactamase class C family)
MMKTKKTHQIMMVASLIIALAFSLSGCSRNESADSDKNFYSPDMTAAEIEAYTRFEEALESIRQKSMIPGFSAAIVKDQQVVWAAGFGYADLEKGVKATPSTPYPLASLTKPFAAAIIMQLVEEGTLSLEDPISDYGVDFSSEGVIELRHVLSHTSNGVPGEAYRYNGDRFADLGYLIRNASGRSFRELLNDRILEPLEMNSTAPRPISMGDDFPDVFRIWLDADNARVYRASAKPYRFDQEYNLVEGGCPDFFTPAAGLNSTVLDMAEFDIAMDQNILLEQETKMQMFTPTLSNDGSELPYGIGWFTQEHKGQSLIWHYGWQPSCGSSLILKVPDENITFILMGNTDNLSRPYRLGSGEVLPIDSTLALAFYKIFIFEPQNGLVVPHIDWELEAAEIIDQLRAVEDERQHEILQRELLAYRKLFYSVGRTDQAEKLLAVHEHVYADPGARLENSAALLEPGGDPWIYVPMPGMAQIITLLFFFLAAISILISWPLDFLVARVRSRKAGADENLSGTRKAARTARVMASLVVVSNLLVIVFYVICMAGYPDSGELAWRGGTVVVKALILFANLSVVGALLLLGLAIRAWIFKYWNIAWRIHYSLVAFAVWGTAFAWQAMGFWGWI